MIEDTATEKIPARKRVSSYGDEPSYRDDEIDLVDLWIFFWDRRKLFLISAMLVVIVGITGFELLYTPKRVAAVRSLMETRDIAVDTRASAPAYLAAYIQRLKIVDLPRLASAKEFSRVRPYLLASSIIVMNGTEFIEVVTNAPASAAADVSRFHNELTAHMASEIQSPVYSKLYVRVASANREMELLRAKLIALQQEVTSETAAQTSSSYPKQNDISKKLGSMMVQIDGISKDLDVVTRSFQHFTPRVLIAASVAEKSTGIKKSTAYTLIVLLAMFLGIFVVIGDSFVARVRERMESRS